MFHLAGLGAENKGPNIRSCIADFFELSLLNFINPGEIPFVAIPVKGENQRILKRRRIISGDCMAIFVIKMMQFDFCIWEKPAQVI